MNFKTILLFTLLFTFNIFCKGKLYGQSLDDLAKYSYMVKPYYNNESIGTGTGFFIKLKNNYYFVTALHVLTGVDPITKTFSKGISKKPNNIVIGQKSGENKMLGSKFQLYSLNKSQLFSTHKYDSLVYYDISFIEVEFDKIPYSNFINENDIETSSKLNIGDSIFCFGFSEEETLPKIISGKIINEVDIKNNYFETDLKFNHGVSGAPIFLKKKDKYLLIGISSIGIFENNESVGGICTSILNLYYWIK